MDYFQERFLKTRLEYLQQKCETQELELEALKRENEVLEEVVTRNFRIAINE